MELIDRVALEKHLAELAHFNRLPRDTKELSVVDVEELIDHQRTVDAEPVVHARWMHDPRDISTFYAGDCSNCGCAPKRRTMSFKPWNYCPNCGARMDADAPERGKED